MLLRNLFDLLKPIRELYNSIVNTLKIEPIGRRIIQYDSKSFEDYTNR